MVQKATNAPVVEETASKNTESAQEQMKFFPIKISGTKKTKTEMALEVIDPELAQTYLKLLAPNRSVRPATVSQYAHDMSLNRWHSSVIRFGVDGTLRDGQHRMLAIIQSKTEQLFWVERNVPEAAFNSIDIGIKRTHGDILGINGEPNATTLASAIKFAQFFESMPGLAPSAVSSRMQMSASDLLDYLNKNPTIRESVKYGAKVNANIKYPPSLAAGLHYLGTKRDATKANEFWEQVASGVGLVENSASWALRKAYIEDQLKGIGNHMDRNMLAAISIKAWNFWEYDFPVKQLRWLRGAGESFPRLGQKPK